MRLSEVLRSSISSLGANKLRSFLTMLGVIIGVFAVVSLVSLVKGVENYIVDTFNSLGSNLILVSPGRANFTSDPAIFYSNNKLEAKHAKIIEQNTGDLLVAVSPNIRIGKTLSYKNKNYYATVVGVNEKGLDLVNYTIGKGEYFTKAQVDTKSKVVVLGYNIKSELFGSQDPIGHRIKIGDETFEVIGTLAQQGANADDNSMIPYTASEEYFGIKNLSGITTKAKNPEDISFAMKQIEIALMSDLKSDEFTVLSQEDILASIKSILNVLSIGLGAVAGISLFVGGIGIMNIMLVAVTERTQEIGLRKALGATSMLIGAQFLIESIIVSVSGGLIGLFLAWTMTVATKSLLNSEIPWWAVGLALGFSIFVGMLFGTYPAIKASKKDPIEALRYE